MPTAGCKSCGRPQTSFAYWQIMWSERICSGCSEMFEPQIIAILNDETEEDP